MGGHLMIITSNSVRRITNVNFMSLVKNCNHKRLGIYYLLSALIFGLSGTLLSVFMRIELYSSGNRIIPRDNMSGQYKTLITYYVLLIKSHLQSYPCPLNINYFWNQGFLLGISIVIHIIREVYYGWCIRYAHSSGASVVFLVLFLHIGRGIYYASYYYNPNTWFSGIVLFLLLMATAFMGYVLPWGQMSFWGATVITNLLSPFPCLIEW